VERAKDCDWQLVEGGLELIVSVNQRVNIVARPCQLGGWSRREVAVRHQHLRLQGRLHLMVTVLLHVQVVACLRQLRVFGTWEEITVDVDAPCG